LIRIFGFRNVVLRWMVLLVVRKLLKRRAESRQGGYAAS